VVFSSYGSGRATINSAAQTRRPIALNGYFANNANIARTVPSAG
jgi:hypothetical protein